MTFIRRHSLLTYFALAFAISWVGVLLVIGGPGGIPATPEEFRRLFPAGYLAMLAGPSIAGVLCTGLVHGAAGFREYRSRLLRWRVGVRWYVVALLTAPLVVTVSVWVLSAIVSRFAPGATIAGGRTPPPLVFGILVGSGAGILEELGWTGFAVPEIKRHFGIFATGLLVGLLWGAWHFLATWWGSADLGGVPLPLYLLVALFSFLPPYRVLMVWVYDRTESLFVVMLMHASLTTSMLLLGPFGISGSWAVAYNLVYAAIFWIVAAIAPRIANNPRATP